MNTDQADQLLLLSAIEEQGTLAGAGDLLGLTPPAVSQRLTRAETFWGTRLVERGPRGATLTEAGSALAVHGGRIRREVEDAFQPSPPIGKG